MKIKMVHYGCGKISKILINYAEHKGIELIGAFDIDKTKVGKDICTVVGGAPRNVTIEHSNRFVDFLKIKKPDIVVITTMSKISDIEEVLLQCAANGVNAITTCEEAFFPANSNPVIFNKVHALAKQTNCTICGTGYQDIFWGELISTLASACFKIKKIKGISCYNIEDYGIDLARVHGASLSREEFIEQIAMVNTTSAKDSRKLILSGEFLPSYMWNASAWLCAKLNLNIKSQTQKSSPCITDKNLYSATLGITIPKGFARGMSAVVNTFTEEGIEIESECVGKVYKKGEEDANVWEISGEPNIKLVIPAPKTLELTCAITVNRIVDVINSPSGFVTTNNFSSCKYITDSLDAYLD